ncbi:MAG TPA: hypothetical protein VF801_13010 [Rhodocyclaceae bacterium]
MTEAENDGRMSFDEAAHFVQNHPDQAAFAAMPVFGERTDNEEQRAEGARVFVLQADGAGSYRMYFVAGPFFANVFAANETFAAADIPERARELRFMPTRFDEEWLTEQVQMLIQKLVQGSGTVPSEMPDYSSAPAPAAGETVVPITIVRKP